MLAETMEEKLATKQDLKDLEVRMELKFSEVRQETKDLHVELRSEVQNLELKMIAGFSQMESKLTVRMGAMFAASIAVLTAIQKFI